ncbi:TRAP transporter substrate-binding protein DctP [bacterium]|nr:TRAP transporter substrate-binding protein DctP [bacterium]
MTRLLRPIGLLAIALVLVGCGREETGARRIRLSLILGENSDWYRGAVKWKELVEARTQGRYRVEVVTNAKRSAKSQSQELQDVQQGRLEASLESTILLSTVDRRWEAFSAPWLFASHDVAAKVCDGPAGQGMLDLLTEHNLVGLAYGANGFRQITNNAKPIRTPADLKGLKIRIPQGLPPELLQHFGASAHHMNFGDLIVALRTGEMHGQENPLSVIDAAGLRSVQNHLTLWNYVYDPIVLCVNKDFWATVSEEDRETLTACAREAMAHERQLVAKADEDLPAKLSSGARAMKIARLTPEELQAFKASAAGLRAYFAKSAGTEVLERLESSAREAEASP